MRMMTVRDFRAHTADVWKGLKKTDDVVLTNNGKPMAMVLPVNEENLEQMLKMARRMRAERAFHEIRMEAVRNGTAGMPLDEINAEIALARKELRSKRGKKAK